MELNQKISIRSFLSFRGRAKILEMWLIGIICLILLGVICGIGSRAPWVLIFSIIPLFMLWQAAVRRLHDHNLSGNWLFFLSPIGIALMYMAYVLDLDSSINPVVERIHKTGIFNWILAAAAWFFVSVIVLFCLLFLCRGKDQDNLFGPSPYSSAK